MEHKNKKMHHQRGSDVGKSVGDLVTPCFLINKRIFENNSRQMRDNCQKLGMQLRGQTKTHKTVEGGIIQTGGTKRCVVVSTLDEAEMYADAGFDDILYGYPFGPQHVKRCVALMQVVPNFHVMIASIERALWLAQNPPMKNKKWSVVLKVDCGNKRAGVWWESNDVVEIAKIIHNGDHANLLGIYSHCGNSYSESSGPTSVRDESISRVTNVAERIRKGGVTVQHVGIGSTPSCSQEFGSIVKSHGLTEMHPGNYVFYDAQQLSLKTCTEGDVAVRVGTRVIGHYPHRNQILIDAGFTALTRQGMGVLPTGCAIFQGHPNLKLVDMTQEIGKVETVEGKLDYSKYPVGSMLYLYPYHSCATAEMHPVYHVHDDNGKVIEEWVPTRGW